ncbi:MAG: tRNA pseudouridine(38-40) synthase TruA [Bacteroidales bacterium]|nr:tRNA pseudouridine(38-40) synthase TruA [Bacteroidales bacterium]
MHRYFLNFSYDGSAYHGWQIQPNALSVQEVMTSVLRSLFEKDLDIIAAGRTDAGVHALDMTAHFDTAFPVEDLKVMANKLDRMLPADIAIHSLRRVRPEAHARFDALSRTYQYRIVLQKDPFLRDYSLRLYYEPDVEAMNKAAARLLEYSDFTSFSKVHTDVRTFICKVMQAHWERKDSELIFTIQADRFLRNMVRAVVGSLLEVGKGKIDEKEFCNIIEARDRCRAGTSMPARALYLTEVKYSDEVYLI